ncbi:MAG: nitrous oxide reductase accessory protein NosL [Desulfomonilaceae bacterium]
METRIGFVLGRRNFIKLTGAVGMALMAIRGIATAAELTTPSPPSALAPREGNPDLTLPDGAKVDLAAHCPVCGMTIGGDLGAGATYSYRNGRAVGFAGVAAVVFKDGHTVGFEGARCLFIYNKVPKRFGINLDDITRRFATDFTTRKMIDVSDAFLVLGSTVKGPMGYDLIPFSNKEEAEKFEAEYNGKRLVQLQTVDLKDVDRPRKLLDTKP